MNVSRAKKLIKKKINSSRLVHIRRHLPYQSQFPPSFWILFLQRFYTFLLILSPKLLHIIPPCRFIPYYLFLLILSIRIPCFIYYLDFQFPLQTFILIFNLNDENETCCSLLRPIFSLFFFFFKQFRKVKNNYKPTIKRD